MMTSRPNILFITADQWRGDCLGYAGHGTVKTPHMDALATEATVFLRHYAPAAPCSPARAGLYTGLYQMNNRVVNNGTPLAHRFDNVAKAARRAGYTPTLFGYTDIAADPARHSAADPALHTYEGVLPGFEVEQALLGDQAPWKRWLRDLGYGPDVTEDPYLSAPEPGRRLPYAPAAFATEHSQTAYLAGRFLDWLDEQAADRPWFAHLSLIHPHPPFVTSSPYHEMYPDEPGPAFLTCCDALADHPVMRLLRDRPVSECVPGAVGRLPDLGAEDKHLIRSVYYGLISEVDAQIGRLMRGLRDKGLWQNTVIVVTSDHGEMMGDYGLFGKGGFLPESQHIPLIIRLPGAVEAGQCKRFTSAVDVLPTLLHILDQTPTNSLDGHSLMPFLNGENPDGWREAVMWEYDFRSRLADVAPASGQGAENGCHLLARLSDAALYVQSPLVPPVLFDLAKDPERRRNAADDPAAMALRLREAEALLRDRLRHNDQTLSNIVLGSS